MNKSRERNALYDCYPTVTWKRRVREMPDNQVIAIYKKFEAEGRFDGTYRPKEKPKEEFHQMDIFEFIGGR